MNIANMIFVWISDIKVVISQSASTCKIGDLMPPKCKCWNRHCLQYRQQNFTSLAPILHRLQQFMLYH